MTFARVAQDANFKRCCLKSKRFEGSERHYYFQGVGMSKFVGVGNGGGRSKRPPPICFGDYKKAKGHTAGNTVGAYTNSLVRASDQVATEGR